METTSPLETKKDYQEQFQEIGNKIYSAKTLDDILVHLNDDIAGMFDVERTSIFTVDGKTRELIAKHQSDNHLETKRVPISKANVPGHVVIEKKIITIRNASDAAELKKIDASLSLDPALESKQPSPTRQVLAAPIEYRTFTLGAIELINCKNGALIATNKA